MKRKSIPAAEMEVLACLDRLDRATASELRDALRSQRPMTHGAMLTLLKRLEVKKLVGRRKGPVGKAFVYALTERRVSAFNRMVRDLVQRIFHGDGSALVASLFEIKPPNAAELEKIQQMVDDLRAKSAQAKDKEK